MGSWLQSVWHFLSEDYFMSDQFLATIIPTLLYWVYSGLYMTLYSLEKYRLHPTKEAGLKNAVTPAQVAKGLLVQQSIQMAVIILIFALTGDRSEEALKAEASRSDSLLLIALQFFVGMVVTDTYQYFTHWYVHYNKFLYRHFHSFHHRVVVTHAFAALYGHHTFDGISDTLGTGLAFSVSGMSIRTSIYFFSFSIIKAVDDHCGMWLPWNPFHMLFSNNTAFHDFHHQLGCGMYNFSQPFFVTWDKIMGTYMPVSVENREGAEGFVVKSPKDE